MTKLNSLIIVVLILSSIAGCKTIKEKDVFYEAILPQISKQVVGIRNYPIPPNPEYLINEKDEKSNFHVTIDTCVTFCNERLELELSLSNISDDIDLIPIDERDSNVVLLMHALHDIKNVKSGILPFSNKYSVGCQTTEPCVIIQVSDVVFNQDASLALFVVSADCGNYCSWESFYLCKKIDGYWFIDRDYTRYIE